MPTASNWSSQSAEQLRSYAKMAVMHALGIWGKPSGWRWTGPDPDIRKLQSCTNELDSSEYIWVNPFHNYLDSGVRFNLRSGVLEVFNAAYSSGDGAVFYRLSAEEAAETLVRAWRDEINQGKGGRDFVHQLERGTF